MAVAIREPQAKYTLEGVSDHEDSTRTRKIDTRLFGYENDDQSIQPCADEGRQAGFPRVVQRDRLSLDTRGIEIGDLEG